MSSHTPRRRLRPAVAALAGTALVAGGVLMPAAANAAEEVDLRFDFGGSSSPVADGWVGIDRSDAYDHAAGYGFTTAPSSFRDRGGDDLVARDFTIGASSAFAVDVPNGTYEVTTWAGDLIAGNRTNLDIEGTAFTGPRTSSGQVHEEFFPAIEVADGQLNVTVTGGDGRINGITVQTPLPAPANLAATEIDADGDLSVTLGWDEVADATGYTVYRAAPGGELAELGTAEGPTFTDATVALGESYEYAVATAKAERTSRPSEPIEVAVVDPSVAPPAQPQGLAVADIDRNTIALEWDDADDVVLWKVFRSTREDIPFAQVAEVDEPTWTDDDVLTTRPYLYRLVALNAGGRSEASDTLSTPIATTLVRDAEYLDRAPVAVALDEGTYVGWRLLGLDDRDLAFNVYRDDVRVNAEPITGATNLVDPDGAADSRYRVTALVDGDEVKVTDVFGTWDEQYLDIPLDRPAGGTTPDGNDYTYAPGDASVGDLDGDGQYELVMAWNPSISKDNSQSGYTGKVLLDAFEFDGTRLWRMDLGVNIRAGAHYTQFQVFDLDGDGRAEVSFKTADGVVDGTGAVIGDADADHRNSAGYVLSGPEYLTVFDGATGAALDTTDYLPARGSVGSWGDTYGNRVDRFLAGTGYFDGEHPSLLFSRGYYTRTVLVAWDFRDGELVERWSFDSDEWGDEYEGQGNHQLATADVDRDGLDEVVFGAMTIDDDGTPLYNSELYHGDAMHVADHVVDRPGLEIYGVFEDQGSNGDIAAAMRDAETGEVIWATEGTRDTGRGAAADLDPAHPGSEAWSVGGDYAWNSPTGFLKSADGEVLSTDIPAANFVTWWDGDLLREITDHDYDEEVSAGVPTISKWDPDTQTEVEVLRAEGTYSNNTTKGTPVLQADLFGDWREELVVRHQDGEGIRIYTTTDVTDARIPTLMHDSQYRMAVAWQNTSYNQPPHPSFHLGVGMEEPPMASIAYVNAPAPGSSAPKRGTLTDTDSEVGANKDGDYDVVVGLSAGSPATMFRLYENGELVATVLLDDAETPQSASVSFRDRDAGTYEYAGELLNANGTTATTTAKVKVD
ncbi:hypothetical protein [Agromyces sp. SYSU T00194]|uniref:rhamnogalacturonan lyase family protein n=1 Tax=Agromyces chitinivorans TaxID=3158560 RepID=UPI003396E774